MNAHRRRALTLIELLVVIAIIGVLFAILLPAVLAARESARRVQCQNNLRQLALAMQHHNDAIGHLPSAGWGGSWTPHPDRGSGKSQPGGWLYGLLPYLEQTGLRQLGAGSSSIGQREVKVAMLVRTSLNVTQCPSRRSGGPFTISFPAAFTPFGSIPVAYAARSDYAANAGCQRRCEIEAYGGPQSLEEGDHPGFPWPDVTDHNGVCFLRSELPLASVHRGLSQTYLVGEKHLYSRSYHDGTDHGDDWSMYAGYQDDNSRCTFLPPLRDAAPDPASDAQRCRFGSAHPSGWNVAYCDGAVSFLSHSADSEIHTRSGDRTGSF